MAVDSTIAANFRLHNTLWVPAHFHTYMLAGMGILAGYFYHRGRESAVNARFTSYQKAIVGGLVASAIGFLSMFYLSGAYSVPRRFAVYPAELAHGTGHAAWASVFGAVLVLGIVLCAIEIISPWRHDVGAVAEGTVR